MKNRFGFMFYVASFFLCPFYYIKKQKFWVKFFVKSTKKNKKKTNKQTKVEKKITIKS